MGPAKQVDRAAEPTTGLLPLESRLGVDSVEGAHLDVRPIETRRILGPIMMPLPPSTNAYWSIVYMALGGLKFPVMVPNMRAVYRMFRSANVPSEEAKAYKKDVIERFLQAGLPRASDARLMIDIVVCPRDRRKIDIDNRVKPLLDTLKDARLLVDDEQFDWVCVRRGPIIREGRVVVTMSEMIPDYDAVLASTGWGKVHSIRGHDSL